MARFDTQIENLFGCVAILMAAIMAQAACYAASILLGDIALPLIAIGMSALIVRGCRGNWNRVLATTASVITTAILIGVLSGFSAKIRLMFYDLSDPFPVGFSWSHIVFLMIVPLSAIAGLSTWLTLRPTDQQSRTA